MNLAFGRSKSLVVWSFPWLVVAINILGDFVVFRKLIPLRELYPKRFYANKASGPTSESTANAGFSAHQD